MDCGRIGDRLRPVRRRVGGFSPGAEFGDGEPVVFVGAVADPGRQGHAEIFAERESVSLVERAHFAQPLTGVIVEADFDAAFAEHIVELLVALWGKTVGRIVDGIERKDLREVDQGVARHGKGELGLARFASADTGDEERGCIENRGERAYPALIVVLGAEVTEQRIRDVAFEQLGRPAFPLYQQQGQGTFAAFIRMASHEFRRGGWRAGARIEQRDADFAA